MNKNNDDNNELDISEDPDEIKPFKKRRKNKIYPKLLKQYNEIHYYYTDNNKYEWEYLEINGTKLNYYFKCSTGICKGFGMIERNDKLQKFKITKIHDLPYYKHIYFIKAVSPRKLINEQFKEEEWKNEKIRINLFKWYFLNNKEDTEETCKHYFTKYLKNIFNLNEVIKKGIKKSRLAMNYSKGSYITILNKLENLKDTNEENVTYTIDYEHYNKIK